MRNCTLLLAVLLCIIYSSCDYVTAPYPKSHATGPVASGYVKKVLLEDYTAQQCVYCPGAAIIADQIRQANGGRVITMGIHVGGLATPGRTPFSYDFRTVPGTNFDNLFNLGNALPSGMIDRVGYPTSTHAIANSNWSSTVATRLAVPPSAFLTITNTYNSTNRNLGVKVKINFLTALSGSYKLTVLLTEDSIVKPQKDITATPTNVLNYVHHYVLRDAINGTGGNGWGDLVTLPHTPTLSNDSLITTYTYTLPANFPASGGIPCNDKHCYVVAYIYDASSLEVIQVEEKKVR